jgi:hypothetical protein
MSCIKLVMFAPFYPAAPTQSQKRSVFRKMIRPKPSPAIGGKASRNVALCVAGYGALPIMVQQNDVLHQYNDKVKIIF